MATYARVGETANGSPIVEITTTEQRVERCSVADCESRVAQLEALLVEAKAKLAAVKAAPTKAT